MSLIQLKFACFYDYAQYDLIETANTINTSFLQYLILFFLVYLKFC